MKYLTSQKGFTLIEMLVAISIVGILMISMSLMLASSLRGVARANNIARIRESAEASLVTLNRQLRLGIDITSGETLTAPVNDRTVSLDFTGYDFKEPSVVRDMRIELVPTSSNNGVWLRVFDENGIEVRDRVNLVNEEVIVSDVQIYSKDNVIANDRVYLQFSLTPNTDLVGGTGKEQVFSTAITFRNK